MRQFIFFILVLVSEVPSMAATLKAQPYLSGCKDKMSLLDRSQSSTVEDKFVALADSPEKMLQLIYDYNLVFSDEFAKGLHAAMDKLVKANPLSSPLAVVRKVIGLDGQSQSQLDALIWEALDNAVALRAVDGDKAQGQVRFIKGKNLVEALKTSQHRDVFEGLVRVIVRDSILKYVGASVNHHQVLVDFGEPPPRWAFLFGSVYSYIKARKNLKSFKEAVSRDAELEMIVSQADKDLRLTSDSVFDYLEWRERQPALRDACQGYRCTLSPPQIIYLGDAEIVELESFSEALRSSVKLWNVEFLEQLELAARAVYEAPENLEKQGALETSLRNHALHVDWVSFEMGTAFRSLSYSISALTQFDFNILNQQSALTHRDQDPDKAALFRSKLQKDLQKLQQIKINAKGIIDKLKRMEFIRGKLKQLQQRPLGPKEEWKKLAEEILVSIDELK